LPAENRIAENRNPRFASFLDIGLNVENFGNSEQLSEHFSSSRL
jgi:hypothetical protein